MGGNPHLFAVIYLVIEAGLEAAFPSAKQRLRRGVEKTNKKGRVKTLPFFVEELRQY
jgi:hypothetical protein